LTPSKSARFQAALPEQLAASARAQVVAAKFFFQEFIPANYPNSDLHLGL
jgi:hypothetical protein